MKRISLYIFVLLIIASLQLSACAPTEATEEENKPVSLEPIAGTDLNRLTLTEKAAERLGLETATVLTQQVDGLDRLVVPYAALLYDTSGTAWVYVNVEPLVFVRQIITVDSIQGDQVILSEGLEAGDNVVTLGATELYGSESEFEEE
jgi:multidrug efflux pump subunit AcrA (membrane-fusion protein)